MNDPCLRDEEIPALAATPDNDPRREHLARCARCRSLLAAYQDFLSEPGEDVDGLDEAEAEMRRTLDQQAPPRSRPAVARSAQGRDGMLSRLFSPRPHPAWIAVAAVVVAVTAWLAFAPRGERETVWRGRAAPTTASPELRIEPVGRSGPVVLHWTPVAGATGYRVLVSRDDLSEIATLDAGVDTHYALDLATLSGAPPRPARILIQIEARRDGDVIATSRTVDAELP